jgi:hypothetical protein
LALSGPSGGEEGFSLGFIGALMKVSFFYDLYRSERILGSISAILATSSNILSNIYNKVVTKFSGLVEYTKSSSFIVLYKSKVNNASFLTILF